MKRLQLLLLLSIIACLSGCTSGKTMSGNNDKLGFERDEKWILTSVRQKEVVTSDDSEKLYIQFNPETNNFSGYAGCNNFFGDYRFKPSSDGECELTLDHIGATQMMCPDEAMKLESTILPLLNKTTNCKLTGYTLTLKQGNKILLVFEKL